MAGSLLNSSGRCSEAGMSESSREPGLGLGSFLVSCCFLHYFVTDSGLEHDKLEGKGRV